MVGWIKLHRKIIDWEWYSDVNTKVLFIHFLLSANIEDKNWKGVEIKRGSFITSIQKLSSDNGISIKAVRVAIEKLKKGKEIEVKGANRFTYITVCNFDSYQCSDYDEGQTKGKQQGKQRANEGQTKGKQRANEGQQLKNTIIEEFNNDDNEIIEKKELPNGIDFFEKNLHSKFIEIYVNWYYKKIGAKYKFSGGADGTAAKQMINYIRAAQKEKNGYESTDDEILNAWEFILNNWAKWESFYQGQMKLSQINSNMANIMANIKGISKNGNNLTAKDDWNEITRIIATMGK